MANPYNVYHRLLYCVATPFNKVSKLTQNSKLTIIFIASALSIVLGSYAYLHEGQPFTMAFFNALQTLKLSSTSPKSITTVFLIAKWLGALVFIYSIIQVALGVVKSNVDGLYIYLFYRKHFVFCGFSKKTLTLLQNLRKDSGYKYVQIIIIEKDKSHEAVSKYQHRSNVTVLIGNCEDEEVLKRANINKAEYVFALTNYDDVNAGITAIIQKKYEEKNPDIKIRTHINDFTGLMFYKQFGKGKSDYHAFNAHQLIAQKLVDKYAKVFDKIDVESPQVHVLVDGLTKQGEYIIYESAMMYHFLNLQKLKISIVDIDVEKKISDFTARFPSINNVVDIIPVHATELEKYPHNWEEKLNDVALCFVCHNDDAKCITRYKTLRQSLYALQRDFETAVVVAILPENSNITDTKGDKTTFKYSDKKSSFERIIKDNDAKSIGVQINTLYETFTPELILENHAKTDYLAKRIDLLYHAEMQPRLSNYERKRIIAEKLKEFGKKDEQNWTNKTDFEKDWNRYPARHFEIKKRLLFNRLKCSKNEDVIKQLRQMSLLETFKEMEHRRWCAEKWLTGYVKGKEENGKDLAGRNLKENLKYHPWLIDYKELPDKVKDIDGYTLNEIIFISEKERV